MLAGILKQIRLNKSNVIGEVNKSKEKDKKTDNNASNVKKMNKDENAADFQITDLTPKKEQPILTSKTKHLSLMKDRNISFFKKLFNSVFKKKSNQFGGSNSVENLFSPVPSAPCETILHDQKWKKLIIYRLIVLV